MLKIADKTVLAVSLTVLLFAGSAYLGTQQAPEAAVKATVAARAVKPDFAAITDVKKDVAQRARALQVPEDGSVT